MKAKQALKLVPSLTALHSSYRGFHITRYSEPEGYRYEVTTLTGKHVTTQRTMANVKKYVNTTFSAIAR